MFEANYPALKPEMCQWKWDVFETFTSMYKNDATLKVVNMFDVILGLGCET